jgi:hypothetical protein
VEIFEIEAGKVGTAPSVSDGRGGLAAVGLRE